MSEARHPAITTGPQALTIADERLRRAVEALRHASPEPFGGVAPEAKEIFAELDTIARDLERRRLEFIHRWSGRLLEAGADYDGADRLQRAGDAQKEEGA